ncbi:MAG: Hsp20/alpha crystallin family protein [Caldilineaceae bacterium]|nr:Hsp20/alpha crystallin family protein [Caldilineaceae bacterium]MBP9073985.1 Hsp20/alpha crystallin family protein [Caldilineaceae bacterium]
MSTLMRWDPYREFATMRNLMDRVFEDTFGPAQSLRTDALSLALDVAEQQDGFVVKASVPGINPDDLDISLTNDVLTIRGETKADTEIDEETYHLRERRVGSFMRSVTLPVPVQADKVDAAYENGVLTLTLPKAEELRPKKIAIKANSQKTIEAKQK